MDSTFLRQLELIRDNLRLYAEEWTELWQIVHALDSVLGKYDRT